MKLKRSEFVYTYQTDHDEVTFFNAANLNLLSGDEACEKTFDEFQEGTDYNKDNETIKVLYEKGFLVPVDDDEVNRVCENKRIRYKKAMVIRDNRIGYLRISLTENCNLACKYCFVNKIMDEKNNMSQELFSDIMTWFIKQNAGKKPLVQYFGGEPLLKFDLIKLGNEMLIEAKKKGIIEEYGQEIVTNGTLLSNDMASYLAENDFYISFSLDGTKEFNDKNRIFHDGRGSFNDVINGINIYKKYCKNLSVLITPNNDNIEYFGTIIPYFVEELGITEIAINTPQPYKQGWEISGDKLARAIQETWLYCNKHVVRYNTPANNILFLINNKIPQTFSCMNLTYGQQENTWGIYINSKGRASKCMVECDPRCSCDFYNFIKNNTVPQDFIEWHFKNPMHDVCTKCPGFNICGGPCSIEQVLSEGRINPDKCKFVKTMIPWVMERK